MKYKCPYLIASWTNYLYQLEHLYSLQSKSASMSEIWLLNHSIYIFFEDFTGLEVADMNLLALLLSSP